MPEPALEALSVRYGYRRGQAIVDDFSASAGRGTVTAITGRSGTGKSTMLYLLAGLLTPWSGQVLLDGQSLGGLSDVELSRLRARRFGFVFQDVVLDPRRTIVDSVLEPCLYAGVSQASRTDRAMQLLNQLEVDLRAASRPGEISGGQAQRVGVCRALLLEPDLVFADEPTGNLDDESADIVLSALEHAADDGCTVLVATHDPRVVERCSGQIVMA